MCKSTTFEEREDSDLSRNGRRIKEGGVISGGPSFLAMTLGGQSSDKFRLSPSGMESS